MARFPLALAGSNKNAEARRVRHLRHYALLFLWLGVYPFIASGDTEAALNTDQIVQHMVERNAEREGRCQHYTNLRDYHVVYHGFLGSKEAQMQVEMSLDPSGAKHFRVLSSSGSKVLVDHVFKRLMDSEQEASTERNQIALTPANYKFELEKPEEGDPGAFFVLRVVPRVDSKFLYRGKIWVDKTDYAVAKLEAQPAKNPSFWIKNTEIHQSYKKIGDCWLPGENQSETKVRFGGISKLTIVYSKYEMGG